MVSSGHWGLYERNWSWGFRDVELRDVLSLVVSRGCHQPMSYVAGIVGGGAAAEWELEREGGAGGNEALTIRVSGRAGFDKLLYSSMGIAGIIQEVMGNAGSLHHRALSVIVLPVHRSQYFYNTWGLSYLYSIPGVYT